MTECCLRKREAKTIIIIIILGCTFVSYTMVSCLNRYHLPLNPATYRWQKEDDFWVPVWFEGNALPNEEELTAISLESVKIDT